MEPGSVADVPDQGQSTPKPQTIRLHVLSPSAEVPNKLTFPLVDISTTVGELKRKIQDAVDTKPAPERQRLIYRGKPLTRDNFTLKDVFGEEAVDASEALSLHLVLPPTTGTLASTIPSSIPRQAQIHNAYPQLPQRPASTGQLPGPFNGPNIVPSPRLEGDGPRAIPPNPPHTWHNPDIPMQPHLQTLINAHLATLTQQLGGHLNPQLQTQINQQLSRQITQQLSAQAVIGVPIANAALPQNHGHPGPWNAPAFPSPLHNALAQQQARAAAAAGLQGVAGVESNQYPRQDTSTPQESSINGAPGDMRMQGTGPGTMNRVVREGQGPNGSQWRMVINASTTASLTPRNSSSQVNDISNARLQSNASPIDVDSNQLPRSPGPPPQNSPSTGSDGDGPRWSNNPSALMQERLSMLERVLDNGGAPSESDIWQTRLQLRDSFVQHPSHHGGLETPLSSRLNNLSIRAAQARARLTSIGGRPSIGISHVVPSLQPPTESMVYLLSSPNGPHALLISPSGLYSTPSNGTGLPLNIAPTLLQHQPSAGTPERIINPQPNHPNEQQPPANGAAVGQVAQQPQQDQARGLVRVLIPLGGHIWLLIRLFGFVYFFTSGAGWRRTILLGICAIIVFISQTALFRPLQQAIWDPIRRHVEGLVPLAGIDRPAAPGPRADRPGGAEGQLLPRDAADRLLQEGAERDGNVVQTNLRRAERAIALFVASLVPGVGERHIAAREAAEAARQAELREREEQDRREAEEARQREETGSRDDAVEGANADAATDLARQDDQPGPQVPLVEI